MDIINIGLNYKSVMEIDGITAQCSTGGIWPMTAKILSEKSPHISGAFIPTLSQIGSETNDQKVKTGLCPQDTSMEFCNGYIDCAKESIRFLTEVEHLPLEHPLVVGLQEELHKRIQIVGFQMVLQGFIESEMINDTDSEKEEFWDEGEKRDSIQKDATVCDLETKKQSTGSQLDSEEEEVELATSIAEQIYDMLYGGELEDGESNESEEPDNDPSFDEGFHSGQE